LTDDSFGHRLRRERERRQIPLASIAANTKINIALFEGLERDDVSRWPSGIFRRSFIRAYAIAIGLNPDDLTREFLGRFPDTIQPLEALAHPPVPAAKGSPSRPPAESSLRLTLADAGVPFTGGRFLAPLGRRLSAAACDLGVIAAVGVGLFVVLDRFWMPFCVSTLLYYVGGILLLGNTPGVCLFAPAREREESGRPPRKERLPVPLQSPAIGAKLERLQLFKHSVRRGLAHTRKTLSEAAKQLPSRLTAPRDV
jgi:transcriptional regulator with XRE-family HTH domain